MLAHLPSTETKGIMNPTLMGMVVNNLTVLMGMVVLKATKGILVVLVKLVWDQQNKHSNNE